MKERAIDRLKLFLEYARENNLAKGQNAFEKMCGLGNGYVSNSDRSSTGNIGSDVIYRISKKFPQLNISWLCTGNGCMIDCIKEGVFLDENNIQWCSIYDNSMIPIITPGDKIGSEKIDMDDVVYGQIYLIKNKSGISIIRWVSLSPIKGKIRLIPENKDPKFGDYQDVFIKDITAIYRVKIGIRTF